MRTERLRISARRIFVGVSSAALIVAALPLIAGWYRVAATSR